MGGGVSPDSRATANKKGNKNNANAHINNENSALSSQSAEGGSTVRNSKQA
jgi:hypothetical protein